MDNWDVVKKIMASRLSVLCGHIIVNTCDNLPSDINVTAMQATSETGVSHGFMI